jgi:SAM-dependent methyltransferase
MLHQIVRYSAVVPLIEELRGGTVLDVGSGSDGVAGWLGPGWDTTALDRTFDVPGAMRGPHGGSARMLTGDARALPFADQEFDAVLALDVMEHIPAEYRRQALGELVRVARRRLIVAGPAGPAALAADLALAAGLRGRGMTPPSWLLEHEANGFPDPGDVLGALEGAGSVRQVGSENLRWHALLFRFELRRPGSLFSRASSAALIRWLARGGVVSGVARVGIRLAQGPRRGPHYRLIAILDR